MHDPDRAADLGFGYCVRRLATAPRSEHDLRTKLAERGYEDGVIHAVLGRLRRAGYVDDERFAQEWVRSRATHKSLTAPVLRRELREKGIADGLIDEALEAIDPQDEDDRARELLRRRTPEHIPDDRAERDRIIRRLIGVLARKGYAPGRAWGLVNEIVDQRAGEPSCRA